MKPLVFVKGAGDVGSAVAHRLFQAGWPVILLETTEPATARRGMSFAEAVFEGRAELESVEAVRVDDPAALTELLERGRVLPLFVGPIGRLRTTLSPSVVVDARLRKRERPERQLDEAPLTIGLGPGFRVGETTHLAIETNWGPNLGAVLEQGETDAYTGQPRVVRGYARERYTYAPTAGLWQTSRRIGDPVRAGDPLGTLDGQPLMAAIDGLVRGVTRDGVRVTAGAKVADVDPRGMEAEIVGIAERPRRIASGVLNALQRWLDARAG